MSEWIPASERLPSLRTEVLGWHPDDRVRGWFRSSWHVVGGPNKGQYEEMWVPVGEAPDCAVDDPIYWMPMPEPPTSAASSSIIARVPVSRPTRIGQSPSESLAWSKRLNGFAMVRPTDAFSQLAERPMETKDYNLTCGEVIDNLLTLADAYEKASAGKAPNGFACNPTDAAANMKAAVHFIGSFGQQLPQWISARERVPDHGGTVVCRTVGRELRFARVMRVTTYADGTPATECHWMGYPDGQLEVTHWTELPEPPEDL